MPKKQHKVEVILSRLHRNIQLLGPTGCWEWNGFRRPQGYGEVSWGLSERRIHRISYIAHIGPIPEGIKVLHQCDNPPCFNPDHLFLGTLLDNVSDMIAKGRNLFGEKSPNAKLTESEAIEVLAMAGTMPQREIGELFGIEQVQVGRIIRGERWRHLSKKPL